MDTPKPWEGDRGAHTAWSLEPLMAALQAQHPDWPLAAVEAKAQELVDFQSEWLSHDAYATRQYCKGHRLMGEWIEKFY